MSNARLIIEKVNRYEAQWVPSVIFRGFRIRAILAEHKDAITAIQQTHLLRRKLKKEFGQEGDDWVIEVNDVTSTTDLYLMNSGKLLMWKLQDHEAFSKLFDRVEQHSESINEIRTEQEE